MASIGGGEQKVSGSFDPKGNYTVPLILMISLYFMIGFITVMNDVLIPSLKGLFKFGPNENWKAMLIQFCFFIAYGIMSIPAGSIIKKVGYKKGLALALGVMGFGLFLFVPASYIVSYGFFLFALFVVAIGLAILQVAINPYITALGAPETASSRMNLGGSLNSFATFIGPIIGATFILKEGLTDPLEKASAVRGPYIVLAIVTVTIAAILYFINLPKINSQEDESTGEAPSIWGFKHLLYGSGAIFFYVGAEVAIGSILILYLKSSVGLAENLASSLVAYYWGSAMIGRLIGSIIGQKVSSEKLLSYVSIVAILLVSLSMFGVFSGNMNIAVMAMKTENGFSMSFPVVTIPISAFLLVLVGLFNSVMWPCIFPLGIRNLGTATSAGSGLMVTMVAGGAFIPFIQGFLADAIGYQYSFVICLVCYLYILFFAVKGYKTDYLEKKTPGLTNEPKKKVLDSVS